MILRVIFLLLHPQALQLRTIPEVHLHRLLLYCKPLLIILPEQYLPVFPQRQMEQTLPCLLYTSDAADERSSVDLGGRRIIKKKNN